MNRRGLLSAIAALPFIGRFAADGVALMSAAHPVGPALLDGADISEDAVFTIDDPRHVHPIPGGFVMDDPCDPRHAPCSGFSGAVAASW